MKHYVLVEIDSTAPKRQHDALRQRVATEIHLKFGTTARYFTVPVGNPIVPMITSGDFEIERRR